MTKAANKFTDAQLRVFCTNFLAHYKSLSDNQKADVGTLYSGLYDILHSQLYEPSGEFYHLDAHEQEKVRTAFKAMFCALPEFYQDSASVTTYFKSNPKILVQQWVVTHHYPYRNDYNDWLLLSLLYSRSTSNNYYVYSSNGEVTHRHPSTHEKDKKSLNEALSALFLLVLALAAVAATVIATYYLLRESFDGIERLWHHEGWSNVVIMAMSTVFFGTLSSIFFMLALAAPVASLAVTAGLSPAFFVGLGLTAVTVVGAGAACYLTKWATDAYTNKHHMDALDPSDPWRFGLSEAQEGNLSDQDIDPIAAKCAIVCLRSEMASVKNVEHPVTSFLDRHWGEGKAVQKLLTDVRKIKAGESFEIQVGDLKFNMKSDAINLIPLPPGNNHQSEEINLNNFAVV